MEGKQSGRRDEKEVGKREWKGKERKIQKYKI